MTQAQFHAGTINILVVLSTETALFTAQDTLVRVKYSHLNALVDKPEALAADPLLVKRLRRLRASRQRTRAARRLGIEPW